MTKTHKRFFIATIVLIMLIMALLAMPTNQLNDTVYASSGDYTISKWTMKEQQSHYNARTGCAYIISLTENELFPIVKISYSAYQVSINQEDISKDDEGNITQPFAKSKEGENLDSIEVLLNEESYGTYNEHRYRKVTFEVTAYEWSAFQFTVEWQNGDEFFEEVGDFVYCTNIDDAPPYIGIKYGPVYQQDGYYYEYMVSNRYYTDRNSDSGFKKIRVYRVIDDNEETLEEYTSFIGGEVFRSSLVATKGKYYIEAIDGVDNLSFGLVTNIEFDINKVAKIGAVEETLKNKADYEYSLIRNLEYNYVLWQIAETNKSPQKDIDNAYSLLLGAQSACFNAKKNFEMNIINNEYIDGKVVVENFDINSFSDILNGETVTMNIAFALFDTSQIDKSIVLETALLPNAKKIYALDIKLFSNLKDIKSMNFDTPIAITIPMKKYNKAVAINIVDNDGIKTYTKLRVDEGETWITVYVESTSSVINLIVDEKDADSTNLKLLYLLFLIVPLGGIVIFIIYRKKIFVYLTKLKNKKLMAKETVSTNAENIADATNKDKSKNNKNNKIINKK